MTQYKPYTEYYSNNPQSLSLSANISTNTKAQGTLQLSKELINALTHLDHKIDSIR